MMNFIFRILIIFCFLIKYSYANNDDIQKQLDIQKEIIENQAKRIDQLEVIIKELKNNLPTIDKNDNDEAIKIEKNQEEAIVDKSEDVISVSKNKKYNPETAFFGPLPQLRSSDGKYSAGVMGLIQLESAIYNQEANYNTNNDLSDGFIVRRAGLTFAGVSEKDWIWFLSYDYADSGDNPHDGLRAAMAIYRGFKPWWLFVGLFGFFLS